MDEKRKSALSTVLQDLIREEERNIVATAQSPDRRLALLEVCRACDMFFITATQHSDDLVGLYHHGCNRAIKLLLDDSCNLPRAALFPSSPETMRWANAFVQYCGRLSWCEQLVEYERSGLGTLSSQGSTIHFHFTARYQGLESIEREEFEWVSGRIHDSQRATREHLDNVEPSITKMMRPLVRRWSEHFISYDTTPEIDGFFQQRGTLMAQTMFGQDSFDGDAPFGSLPFGFYRALVGVLVGWGLKHIAFASLLVESQTDLLIQNQITLTTDIDRFTESMANALGVTLNVTRQGIELVELGLKNTECCIPGNTPPPLIRVSAQQYLIVISGILNGPFLFMLRNLRHRYRTDWDRAVNGRESVFRNNLYALFPEQRFIKFTRNIELKRNGNNLTDIDAVVIDSEKQVIGLFQLKWQDSFESSMKERSAKLRNFGQGANEWIKVVCDYIEATSPAEMARIFNVPLDLTRNPSVYRLFVIGRNFAHFSGNAETDPRAAWGLWPQILRLVHEGYDRANPLATLHDELRNESPLGKAPPVIEECDIQIGTHKVIIHAPSE